MKTIICMLTLFITLSPTMILAAETDHAEAKARAVERYFELAPIDELMKEMIAQVTTQFPDDQRESMAQLLLKHLDLKTIEGAAKEQLKAHLTLEELNAFVAFMEQPEGRSALSKMKHYMKGLLPVIQGEIQRSYRLVQTEEKPASDLTLKH